MSPPLRAKDSIHRYFSQYLIYDAPVFGVLRRHKVIAIGIAGDVIKHLPGRLRQNAVENVFPIILEKKSQSVAILEGFLFSLYHRGNAYAQKGQVDLCAQQFDRLNLTLNEQISNNPANARLQDAYKYFNKQIFNTYINIAENYPNQKQEVYRICLNQLKTFDKRDPGNEQIQGYIGRFS